MAALRSRPLVVAWAIVCCCARLASGLKLGTTPAAAVTTRRHALGAPAAALATLLVNTGTATAAPVDDEFRLADADKNGRLSKTEFATWFKGNELLTPPSGPFSGTLDGIPLPTIALDVTGLAGVIVAVYALSYAYYVSQQLADAEASAAKAAARKAKQAAAADT